MTAITYHRAHARQRPRVNPVTVLAAFTAVAMVTGMGVAYLSGLYGPTSSQAVGFTSFAVALTTAVIASHTRWLRTHPPGCRCAFHAHP